MFILVIFLSYLLGCGSTIALLVYLYTRYALHPPGTITEQEQYRAFHPLLENDPAKNSTVDTINYLLHFLFQELKDTSKLRRYIMQKLHIEFNELKTTLLGKIFLKDIIIQSFSIGKECPIFTDIQLERQETDKNDFIKEFAAKLNVDYKDGFSVTLDIILAFGYKCQLFLKIKRIRGNLHLEFRREPFSHWLLVFQDEPFIDFEIKSYLSTRESPQLTQIISQQIRRVIRRKQTWPSYKIRYRPFFPTSKQSLPTEILSAKNNNLIPGIFDVQIKYCDRLSIPMDVFHKEKYSLVHVLLTINIDEQMCKDYLHINRDQWMRKEIEFLPNIHTINVKEVLYMDRTEFLIEEFDPIPDDVEDRTAFQVALEDRNIFLLEIQGQEVKTLQETDRFLKQKLTNGYEQKIKIVVGMPLLHSVQVRRAVETDDQPSTTVCQPITEMNSITQVSSADTISLIMANANLVREFPGQRTPTHQAEAYIKFGENFEFRVGPNERFLNIYLWCNPPLDCDVPNPDKKFVLLGYASVALSQIVLDAHMSFNRETQLTLNFRSPHSSKFNCKKLTELRTHKGYDDNMAHGFVTINIKHQPAIERKLNRQETRDQYIFIEKDDEKPLSINEDHELLLSKTVDHVFEDQIFANGILCTYCKKKFWTKTGRQCRNCLITAHKKCEDKHSSENNCTNESIASEDNKSIIDINTRTIAYPSVTKSAFSASDTTTRRSFHAFRNKTINQPSALTLSELSKKDTLSSSEKRLLSQPAIPKSSKLASAASSAYNRFRKFKTKRLSHSSKLDAKKTRSPSDAAASENISEDDLQDIIAKCLSKDKIDLKGIEDLFHERAVDHTAIYAKANELGPELFRDLSLDERKQKFENEISRLQQEIDLQGRIRDERFIEYNNDLTDVNTKRKIEAKINNIEEKIQALGALTISYCSGLQHCYSEMKMRDDDDRTNSKIFDEDPNNQSDDSYDE